MLKLTLDTNGLIAVDRREQTAAHVLQLRDLGREGRIELRLVAASGSENQRGGRSLTDYSQFERWVDRLGFGGIPVLMPLCIPGVGFWGFCVGGDGEGMAELLFKQIWHVLSAGRKPPPTLPLNARLARRYRNVACDVLMMWSHIHYAGDIFVTTNSRDFCAASRKEGLLALGANAISTPTETLQRIPSSPCTDGQC